MFDPIISGVEIAETYTPSYVEDVVELPLLLPRWQASNLETIAHQRGMTAAAMVRHLLRNFLNGTTIPPDA